MSFEIRKKQEIFKDDGRTSGVTTLTSSSFKHCNPVRGIYLGDAMES